MPTPAGHTLITPGDIVMTTGALPEIVMAVGTDGTRVTVRPAHPSAQDHTRTIPDGAQVYPEHDYYTEVLFALAALPPEEWETPESRARSLAHSARALRRIDDTHLRPTPFGSCARTHNTVTDLSGYVLWAQERGAQGLRGVRVVGVVDDPCAYALARRSSVALVRAQGGQGAGPEVLGLSYLYSENRCWHL